MKTRITTYTFDASAKTITFGSAPEIEGFSVITNVVDNVIIYQFNDVLLGGTVTGNVLTLTYNTASMSDTDELMILYEDGVNTVPVDTGLTGLATETTLSSIDGNVNSIAGGIGALATTDSVQALGTIMTDNSQVTQIVDALGSAVSVTGNKLDVNASIDTTGLALAANQQTDALTNAELRATAVPVAESNPIDISGLATSAKQLPDGHAVEVNNFPVDYPLPAAQVSTLTPPAAITGFATSAKQLADNHQVTVSNIANTPVITGFATETTLASIKNTDGIKKITEALPTGTNSIGKISDITTSIVPGTGATNLGKARGAAVGVGDTGVAILGKLKSADAHTAEDDGDYDTFSMTDFHELRTRDQRSVDLANCNVHTDYTVLGNDTINLASSANHIFGSAAIKFDKTNGAANTVYAGVYRALTAINIAEIFEAGAFVGMGCYLSSLTNVVSVFLRIGTDASNYNCWTWSNGSLQAGSWMNLRTAAAVPDYSKSAGNGWNTGAIAYVAFGVEFNSEVNALANILFDHVHIVGGRVTSTDISTSISSTVNTPNININKIAGTTPAVNNGTVTAGTQRVTLASDSTGQVKLAAGTAEIGKIKNSGTFAVQSTNQANSGVDIGDVTINNAAGASAVNIQDGGNSITVDGGVTANAGTNLNTSALALESGGNLASIKTNTDKIPALGQALAAASTPVVLPVDQITTLTPPAAITGFATSAKQDTIIGHIDGIEGSVDGIEALLTTIEGNQLPDGHNVTVDNVSLPVIGTFWQATQPVSGTVTANLSATDNTVLDTIASNQTDGTQKSQIIDSGGEAVTVTGGKLDVNASIDTTGLATSAKQDTLIGHVDGIEGYVDGIETLLTTIDADTGAIKTAVEIIDNAISGSEMQVDVVGALPAGTNAIGKLAANSGVDIGDVDVTSLPAIPAGTNVIGKVGHDISGIGHGVKTVTTAGTDVALAASTPCKKVDIQAQTDNMGLIAMGGSGVDATVATGTGILLSAGDFISIETDDLADIYIDSTVNGEGVRFTYYT